MPDDNILEIEDIRISFGGVTALGGVDLRIRKGDITAIIGPNGAGKTCLLNCINGFYRPERGRIFFQGKEITWLKPHKIAQLGISRTFQNIELYTGMTTVDNLMAARHVFMRTGMISGALFFGKALGEEVRHRKVIERIIDFLEIETIRDQVVGTLSYGLRKRVELGRALALEPTLLLLDEPMAGMNLEEKEDMARFILDIREEGGTTIALVEHDMELVMDISDKVIVLDFGQKIADGFSEEVSREPRVIKAYLGEES